MNIKQLKEQLQQNQNPTGPLIFVVKGSGHLIFEQYLQKICSLRGKVPCFLDWSTQESSPSLWQEDADYQYVYSCEHFSSAQLQPTDVVVCHTTDYVEPIICEPLQSWQLQSYAQGRLPGLSNQQVTKLCEICVSPERLFNEIDKIALFVPREQSNIFELLQTEGAYEDLTTYNIFSLTTALQKKDVTTLGQVLLANQELSPMALLSLLYRNFKLIAALQLSPTSDPQKLGCSVKQYYALKHYVNIFTKKELFNILNFLSMIDYRIKTGDLSVDVLTDYLVTHILTREVL